MYNRYIPQPDGSFRRKKVQELPERKSQTPLNSPCATSSCANQRSSQKEHEYARIVPRNNSESQGGSGSFLQNILPKDLDTGDLLIILLLLLMSFDGSEDSGSTLLTLALYLLM